MRPLWNLFSQDVVIFGQRICQVSPPLKKKKKLALGIIYTRLSLVVQKSSDLFSALSKGILSIKQHKKILYGKRMRDFCFNESFTRISQVTELFFSPY